MSKREQLLAEAEAAKRQVTNILERISDVFIALDTEGRYTYVNAKAAQIFGRKREDLVGKHIWTEFPEGIDQPFYKAYYKAVETQQPIYLEEYYPPSDRWFENRIYPSKEGLSIFFQDITDRKRAEEALAAEHALLRAIIDIMPALVYAKDSAGRKILSNRVDLEYMGASTEVEALGKTDFDFYPEDMAARFYARDQAIIQTGQPLINYEHSIITGDGRQRWLLTSKVPLRDSAGQVIGLVGVGQDITERKQTEKALVEEHNLLRTLIDNLPDLIYVKDTKSRFVIATQADARFMGVSSPDELIGKTDFDFYPQELAMQFYADEQAIIESGQPLINKDEPNTDHAGKRHWILTSKLPLQDSEGRIIGIVGVGYDITERKQAEEELRRYRDHLEELVKERTAALEQEIAVRQRAEQELQHAKEVVEKANQAKSEFLANMSHELRTPLNAILGYAQILQGDNNLTERQRHGLETIHTSGDHLLTLINDILNLSKIEAGRMELQVSDVHLPTFLKNIAEMIQVRASQQGLTFVQAFDSQLPEGIRTDEKRLQEVLLNLLGNAVKFTDQGSVTFRVGVNPRVHPIEGKHIGIAPTRILRFEVEDTGIGIVPEDVEQMFEAFQQGRQKRDQAEGAGLGLAISRRLVRMMGGDLQVESTPGTGSRFWFEVAFPVVHELKTGLEQPLRKIVGYTGNRRTILVVDDESTNRGLLLNLLFPLGFQLIEAVNGQECLEKALQFKPDLILLDLQMPVLDGFSATEKIRSRAELREVAIIAVSANVFEATRQRALAVGFNDFLFKPIQVDQLVALLQTYLGVEWIYAEAPERPAEFKPQPSLELPAIALLPEEEVKRLYAFAVQGNYKKVLEQLAEIEKLGGQFLPFVTKLRSSAKRFDMDAIVEILEEIGVNR
jgi:PAS domain S-box-containing protein